MGTDRVQRPNSGLAANVFVNLWRWVAVGRDTFEYNSG